jgi:hypothetical protein
MIVNVFDAEDPRRFSDARHVTDGRDIMLGGMCNGVAQMISSIMALFNTSGELDVLRLFGHGAEGMMGISVGGRVSSGASPNMVSTIAYNNFDQISGELGRLTTLFAPSGRVDLFGCSVGGGEKGDKLLQRLANLWGVKVRAGILTQFSGTASSQMVFEGPIKTAIPGGTAPIRTHHAMPSYQIQWYIDNNKFPDLLRALGLI